MKKIAFSTFILLDVFSLHAQTNQLPIIPLVLDGIQYNANGKLYLTKTTQALAEIDRQDTYTVSQMQAAPKGAETGILININKPTFNGSVAYGPLNETAVHPTVAFLPKDVQMKQGKALLEIKKVFTKANDFFKYQEKGKGILGYRIMDSAGRIIYEGRVAFEGKGPYVVQPTIVEGPMVNLLQSTSCVIAYETQAVEMTSIQIGDKTFADKMAAKHHEILLDGLLPSTHYDYNVRYGNRMDKHHFKTASANGSRKPFTFAFASANRSTTGGGERDFGGVNYQTSRAIMAAAIMNHAVFMHAQGDITTGGNPTEDGHLMEYSNFKRAFEPFWSQVPVYVGFGDHEPNKKIFTADSITQKTKNIEQFPYATYAGEASFAKAFVHPLNGPESEDGAAYDPQPNVLDFPTYKENVYFYTYDNVAMVVLNTEYWESKDPTLTSGCPEGYIMDQQVKWLKEIMLQLEKNATIDHIFVVVHGAVFPNGDHLPDAMWWNGDNKSRAWVAGKPLSKGTIERRDEILDICVNQGKKFLSFISGDEHNFSFLKITPQSSIYLDNYAGSKLTLSRPFYNINNGAGGSAPYALMSSPWSKDFQYFSAPPIVAFLSVHGQSVTLKALNVETFETVCEDVKLR